MIERNKIAIQEVNRKSFVSLIDNQRSNIMAKKKGQGRGGTSTESGDTKKKRKETVSKKPKSKHDKKSAHIDWIASLARDNASNDGGAGANKIPSKEDRKRKRELKKNRRIEQQRQKELLHEQRRPQQTSIQASENPRATGDANERRQARSLLLQKVSKHRLSRLSQRLHAIRKDTKERPSPYYDLPKTSNEKSPRTSHDATASKKRKRKKWSENGIQPRVSDYSGIGLARMSMYIEFLDPSYYPKLEEEFNEHIPGFFGKQRTKAMKRQTDGNMLWRRLADEKKKNSNNKKFKSMSTDERVLAMIDSTDRSALLG